MGTYVPAEIPTARVDQLIQVKSPLPSLVLEIDDEVVA